MSEISGNQCSSKKRLVNILPYVYAAVVCVMLLMVLTNILLKSPKSEPYGLGKYVNLDKEWYTSDGRPFQISEIDKLRSDDKNVISLSHILSPAEEEAKTLVFRSKNCSVTVSVDGREVYKTAMAEAPFYNHSMGTRWNVVELGSKSAGKEVLIEINQAYEDGRAKIDNFYLGDGSAIIINLIGNKLFGFVVSLMMLFVSILFFCAWIILNLRTIQKDNSLLWLSTFALIVAVWSMLETNLIQLFCRDLRLLQVIDNMMLVAGGVPLYFYLNSMYQAFRSRIVCVLCTLDISYVVLATIFQLTGRWDYHQTLNGAILNYGVIIILLILYIVKQYRNPKLLENKEKYYINLLQITGILMLGLGLTGDLIRYLLMDVMDRAFIIRICLFLFVVLFGSGNIYHMMLLVRKGMQAELISYLAYSDGLTGVGNRTAYKERLELLVEKPQSGELVLVMLDINNLKKVNDTLGHKFGDEMIVSCTNRIKATFEAIGDIYRIGGDEFVVLIQGKRARKEYETAISDFEHGNQCMSMEVQSAFEISIAYGAAYCGEITAESIDNAEHQADIAMYKKKYEMKQLIWEESSKNPTLA